MLILILFLLSPTWPVTLRIHEYMFSGCTLRPDSKEAKLGNSDQEASPSAVKNMGIVLVPCCAWNCIPTAISSDVDQALKFGGNDCSITMSLQ